MAKTFQCEANQEKILVKNIAARGLMRTFTLTSSKDAGTVKVRSGIFPFFLLASTKTLPLTSGMEIKRGFFDASFELSIKPEQDLEVTIS